VEALLEARRRPRGPVPEEVEVLEVDETPAVTGGGILGFLAGAAAIGAAVYVGYRLLRPARASGRRRRR
jgi:hypothetical protein